MTACLSVSLDERLPLIAPRAKARTDARDCPVSGANPAALQAYERALAALLNWRGRVEPTLELALLEAPAFVMAYVMQAYLLVCSRDPAQVTAARGVLSRASGLRANDRERLHLAAIGAAIDGDYELAKSRLAECLAGQPRDVLALHAAQAFDHVTGDAPRLLDRAARVRHAWSPDLPGYTAVLAMQAFGCVEGGDYAGAQQTAAEALERDAQNPRLHHAMVHVYEMTGRPEAGLAWLTERITRHGVDRHFTVHGWWHLALLHLGRGEVAQALRLFDDRVRAGRSAAIADLIDAASLLWRIGLAGGQTGTRWHELAAAWSAHLDDGFCSFNDVHAMLAFVGAGDVDSARRLERALTVAASQPTRYGTVTRQVGLPACSALIAFGRGDDVTASQTLARLPGLAHRLGGSHAQRDVLYLTWLRAIEHVRRPTRHAVTRPMPVVEPA